MKQMRCLLWFINLKVNIKHLFPTIFAFIFLIFFEILVNVSCLSMSTLVGQMESIDGACVPNETRLLRLWCYFFIYMFFILSCLGRMLENKRKVSFF